MQDLPEIETSLNVLFHHARYLMRLVLSRERAMTVPRMGWSVVVIWHEIRFNFNRRAKALMRLVFILL